METFNIYLAGAMSGLPFEEQMEWRNKIKKTLECEYLCRNKHVECFSPPMYYSFEQKEHRSEREVFEFDLNEVRKSDLIIVNFNKPDSIGVSMELAIAKEYRIPIIGLNENNKEIHPWLIECCTRVCDDMIELINHVKYFYLR